MSVQRLVPSHATAYRALMLKAYADHPDAFTSSVADRAALPLAWWAARLEPAADAGECVFGWVEGGHILGVAGLSFETREKTRHKATLFGMVVGEQARGRGLGRQLVQAVLAHARARPGLRVLQLTVTEGNQAAIALYQGCGFEAYGTEPLAVRVGDGFVAKVHMWCDLAKNAPAP
ncbi:GNAT family N-acetyltransferase [Rhodoferax koreense]|uniref:GNAT family N-acetyltransferase n=1 Tax=Rhodoferax koreensis TaxID=1842727 RepID=A0A1P8JZT8_9BURK|nr:GNAT family N-acetyltransferase [Rhodoferax koreense]APW39267.1 GNAT family N-acetyltransferase [Rhodoferax koreense]